LWRFTVLAKVQSISNALIAPHTRFEKFGPAASAMLPGLFFAFQAGQLPQFP
jgi:hypothetical protein